MSGPKLMKDLMARVPTLTIEELLDQVRNEQIRDYANRLKEIQTNSVFELLESATAWDLAQEDVEKLLRIMASEFPTEIAETALGLIEGRVYWSVYLFLQKRTEEPPGCFNRLWCFRSTSTKGTDRQSRGSCS